jgi:hypothetical protein
VFSPVRIHTAFTIQSSCGAPNHQTYAPYQSKLYFYDKVYSYAESHSPLLHYFQIKIFDENTGTSALTPITISDDTYYDLSKQRIMYQLSNPLRCGGTGDTLLFTLQACSGLARFVLKLACIGGRVSVSSCYYTYRYGVESRSIHV